MKKKFFNILAGLILFTSAHADWQDHWTTAVKYCSEKNWDMAEQEFNLAIIILEESKENIHPHVYVDRGRLYCILDRNEEALQDFNKALSSENLVGQDRIRGLVSRMYSYTNLDMEAEAFTDYKEYNSMSINKPKIDFSKKQIIIRNVPDCSCFKELVTNYLIESEICEKTEDIIFFNSGVMIAKRKACNCGCDESQITIQSNESIQVDEQLESRDTIGDCQYNCEKFAFTATIWCSKTFKKSWGCQTSCLTTVEILKDACKWCCNDGSIYKKCVKPIKDIALKMSPQCDPAWD